MKNYNVELPKYIGRVLSQLLHSNNINFEISQSDNLLHFEIICNEVEKDKINEFIDMYNYILKNSELSDKDLQYILADYDFDDIYNVIYYKDFYIYDISNMNDFGRQIFDIYECIELSDRLTRYFDFAEYGEDYLDNVEYVELDNDRVIIFYF